MGVDFFNINFLTLCIVLVLSINILILFINYRNKKKAQNLFVLIFRLFSSFILIVLLIHPIIVINYFYQKPPSVDIYIDNSMSMSNNIKIDSLNKIINQIKFNTKSASGNNLIVNWYQFGEFVRTLESLDFSDKSTDFKLLRQSIINKNVDEIIILTDGLSDADKEEKFNFGKSIHTLGIGLPITNDKINLIDGYMKLEDNKNFIIIDMDYNQLDKFYPELNIYSKDSKILSLVMNELNSSGNVIYNIDFDSLVNKYDDLDIRVENMYVDNNRSNNQINVFNFKKEEKPILLISGTLSLNSQYIKSKLKEINKNVIHIHNLNKDIYEIESLDYSNYKMIVFDNYPESISSLVNYNQIKNKTENLNISSIMIAGPNQDYSLLNKISANSPFSVENKVIEKQKLRINNYYETNVSDFYPQDKYFFINVDSYNDRNIYYEDGGIAVCFNKNNMYMFYSDLSSISYKMNEFDKINFEKFINELFLEHYKQNDKINLYTKRSSYYDNQSFQIQLISDNKKLDFENLTLRQFSLEDMKKNKVYLLDSDKINISPLSYGDYEFKLFNKDSLISNSLFVKIDNYKNEEHLSGQDISYLNRISKMSNAIYYNESSYENIWSYFNTLNSKIINDNKYYDFKYYLPIISMTILLLLIEWYIRQKNGML